ncbi:hypothetical protein [Streptomyces sp. NPDC002067]
MTREGLTAISGAGHAALCVKCRKETTAPVPVRRIERSSGPGATLWACPAHAPDLIPGPMPGELEQDA